MVEVRHLSLSLAVSGFLCVSASASEAAEVIGHITAINDAAVGVFDGDITRLKSGDPVFRDEVVETGPHGSARLVFLDGTVVSLSASSTVKLDTFVYNSDNTASKFIINVSRGAFRFVSGRSRHDVYEIRTPYGLLGTGGTTFSAVIVKGAMATTLRSGAMQVCAHQPFPSARRLRFVGCIPMTKTDTTTIVSDLSARGPMTSSSETRDYDRLCGALCMRLSRDQ
jgi:hypothetical protein